MNFTTTIEIERCLYTLTFSPVYSSFSYKLFVRAVNLGGEVVSFEMKRDQFNRWYIALPAPEWALQYQRDLIGLVAPRPFK